MATKAEILALLLASVPDTYDKRVGSFIYDALAPVAEQIASFDTDLEAAKLEMDISNLTGDALAKRIYERTGLERKGATKAVGSVSLTGTGTINKGDLIETQAGTQFAVTETKTITTTGSVKIEAVIAGSSGMVPANTITLFPVTLSGFTAVTNPLPTSDGFDAESDEDYLQRYYDYIRTPATSGNKAHYKSWAKSISGVGDAKVIPTWKGINTVKVILIDSDKKPASAAIVKAVQAYIDPNANGDGSGEAPIGATCTVVAATGVKINLVVTIVLASGYTVAQAETEIADKITQYLEDIAFVESIVSYAKIGALILDAASVADYSGLTINGGTANITIPNESVAILGTVTTNV